MSTCPYCLHEFKIESRFLKHSCKEKERFEYVKTVPGQIAFNFFSTWMFKRYKRSVSKIEDFTEHSTYNAFVNFAEFVRSISGLADSEFFIDMMVGIKMEPKHWCRLDTFKMYLKCLDDQLTAEEKINKSVDTLDQIAAKYDCELADIFEYVHPSMLIKYIKEQKLSPWLLLNSQKFMRYYAGLQSAHQYMINEVIEPVKWKEEFLKDRKQTSTMRRCIAGLQL